MSVHRGSDPVLLRKEHDANALPFSRSPFVDQSTAPEPGEGEEPLQVRKGV
jgi:hypothetical protein